MGFFDRFRRKLTKDQFAASLAAAIRAAYPQCQVQYDRERFRLSWPEASGGKVESDLTNIYLLHQGVPEADRPEHLKHLVRALLSYRKPVPDDFNDAKPDILPVLRTRTFFDVTTLRAQAEGNSPSGWPYAVVGEHFALGICYDFPEGRELVDKDQLEGWGVTFFEALEIARRNLAERETRIGKFDGIRLYVATTNDSYDSARLSLADFAKQLDVEGDCIAMVPTRDTLLIADSDDVSALRRMSEVAERMFHEDAHPASLYALRLVGDEWEPWLPPAEHELSADFRRHAVRSLAFDYEEQAEVLVKLNERLGRDEYVARFTVTQMQASGEYRTYCVWSRGVPSQLPKTDLVFLSDSASQDAIVASGTWKRVMEVAGNLMIEMPESYPPRYRIGKFPSPEQLAAIGKLST